MKLKFFFTRNVLNGYRILKESDNKFIIENIISSLIKSNFSKKTYLDNYFKKNYQENFELILKQKYMTQFFSKMSLFNVFFLFFKSLDKKLIFPLPLEAIKILKDQNIKVNSSLSYTLWYIFMIYCLIKSLFKFSLFFFKSFILFFKKIFFKRKKIHTHFYLLPKKALPANAMHTHNFFYWYVKNQNIENENISISKKINTDISNLKNNYEIRSDFEGISNLLNLIKFALVCFYFFFLSTLHLFRNDWKILYFLEDLIELHLIKYSSDKEIAKNYIFTNSTIFFKPLWTYEVEKKNSICKMIFYSAGTFNFNEIKFKKAYNCSLSNWKNYYFWDETQKEYYNLLSTSKFNSKIIGYIPHCDNNEKIQKNYDICIFDVTPPRKYFYAKQIMLSDFFSEHNVVNFFKDISELINKYNLKAAFKTKRINKLMSSKNYLKIVYDICEKNKIDIINPEISALKLIEKSKIVISFPFTTPALTAKMMKKQSIYYHPMQNNIQSNYLTRDVEFILTKNNLKEKFDFWQKNGI